MILPIFAATAAAAFWGMLWYHPIMVGTQWMKLAHPGKTSQQINKEFSKLILPLAVIGHAITMTILFYFVSFYLKITTLDAAMKLALILGGLVMSMELTHLPFTKKPLGLYLIDQLYNVAVLLIGAVVITYLA